MPFDIDSDEAEDLAHKLVALTGETLDEAVTRSLQERLERLIAERTGASENPGS